MIFLKGLVSQFGLFFLPVTFLLTTAGGGRQPTITPVPTVTSTPIPVPTETPTPSPTPKPTTTPKPSPTLTVKPTPVSSGQLDNWFTDYSNHYSVNREQLWKIAVCESKLNPKALNGDYAGIFQFSSRTWQTTRKEMNLDSNLDLRFNPEEAIKTAAFKISRGGLSSWQNCANH